jgi:hypothetical protein
MADLQPNPQPRRRLNADRQADLSATVSLRALIVPLAILVSKSHPPELFAVLHRKDVAAFCFVIEMQFNAAGFQMAQHRLNALFDRRMVRAVASDEFLDDGP